MPIGLLELTDEQVMLACQGASPERARQLVGELARRYLERLASFLFGLTGDAAASLDLAQEAFIRVFRHRERYREVARFSTWLYTIARNLALNELRDRRLRPVLAGGAGHGADSGEHATLGAVADPSASAPDAALAQRDLQALVRREVSALPEHYRAVVVLCDLEERPYAEAAEILGVPVGTIRSRLSRAREQLERRLRKALATGAPETGGPA